MTLEETIKVLTEAGVPKLEGLFFNREHRRWYYNCADASLFYVEAISLAHLKAFLRARGVLAIQINEEPKSPEKHRVSAVIVAKKRFDALGPTDLEALAACALEYLKS